MSIPTLLPPRATVIYPDDDGLPRSEDTLQLEYMHTIKGGLDALFADVPNVFIAGNLLWYPVEGDNTIRQAGDVIAVFGRPKGYRGSYRQWEEGGIAPQVIFEILSPGNRLNEMIRKFRFYQRYGVEEYYVYNPDNGELTGYLRKGDELVDIPVMEGWRSPRLGTRFQLAGTALELYRPDGRKFPTYVELDKQWAEERAEKEREHAEKERERAEKERLQREAEEAKQRDQQEQHRKAEQIEQLRAKLKALGVDPDA